LWFRNLGSITLAEALAILSRSGDPAPHQMGASLKTVW